MRSSDEKSSGRSLLLTMVFLAIPLNVGETEMQQNIILLAAVAVPTAILVAASRKPSTLYVERSISIAAPPEKIFPYINDFHSWTEWSPYENRDPQMKRTYSGTESGVGSIYEWNGNDKIGSGRMEILNTTEPTKIVIKLDFFKPFEGHNTAEFTLKQSGKTTNVTWTMQGPANFMSKLMQVFMNMDKMIGDDFSTGLANIKALCEQ
jgi:uncharacterized protein YndB with AHSA1/START domain